jgi:hypothetical protein
MITKQIEENLVYRENYYYYYYYYYYAMQILVF